MNMRPSPIAFTVAEPACGRASRAGAREERLRATAGIEGSLGLSSWRGRSGQRYVVGVRKVAEVDAEDLAGAVLVAVRRDEAGVARVLDIACGAGERGPWLDAMLARGASEVHVHLLAQDEAARRAVARDLRE
jgi:hypothetical protein